jgi:hypothetical protein
MIAFETSAWFLITLVLVSGIGCATRRISEAPDSERPVSVPALREAGDQGSGGPN